MVEHLTEDQGVASSNPAGGTERKKMNEVMASDSMAVVVLSILYLITIILVALTEWFSEFYNARGFWTRFLMCFVTFTIAFVAICVLLTVVAINPILSLVFGVFVVIVIVAFVAYLFAAGK